MSREVANHITSADRAIQPGDGESRVASVVFTDIEAFSTVSEKLAATDLVKLLNEYLTAMSDTILELRGTIDKYEGDAIIAFFGAPVEYPDHAYRACLSAVRMRRIEAELNTSFLERKMTPGPLLTRVGINTGEMVVGNMGTATKMDYTIMGNAVNLAARLEGVNKQYGTWLLVSQATREEASDDFTFRQLDRVRVVGINEPVRLFELVEEKDHTSKELQEAMGIFDQAMEFFEARDWDRAAKSFRGVLKLIENDGPAETYVKRCAEFQKTPPPQNWDGVFNLLSK